MKATQGDKTDFEQPEPGTYAARCYSLIDLGTQKNNYQGEDTFKRQIMIKWELTELMKDGRPFMVMATPTLSIHENAKLRTWLESWRGIPFTEEELKGFDVKGILGTTCMLSLGLTSGGEIKVTGVSKLVKGLEMPAQVNENFYFSLDEFNEEAYDKIPLYWQTKIVSSPEYQKLGKPVAMPDGGLVDSADIPF